MVPPIYGKVRFFTFEMPDILCLYRWKVFKKVIPFHKAKPLIMGNLNRSACILHRLLFFDLKEDPRPSEDGGFFEMLAEA